MRGQWGVKMQTKKKAEGRGLKRALQQRVSADLKVYKGSFSPFLITVLDS